MYRLVRAAVACLCLVAASFAAHAQNYSDIWWNPSESGWGLTIADHQSNLFAVWFTYRQDGKPTWYVIPGGTFTNGHKHFEADIYATTGTAFSSPSFDSSSVKVNKVGSAVIDFASYSAATFTFTIGTVTQTKQIQRQPFGDASPLWGEDVTDIWYNPLESGWGLTLAQHGSDVFGVWFTYDTDGQPFWAVLPGVTFSGAKAFTGTLYTTTGPAFSSSTFDSSQVVVKAEGTATVTLATGGASSTCGGTQSATLQTTLRAASRQTSICHQPFGDTPSRIDFPAAPGVPEGAALFQAPANPINVNVTTDGARAASQVITVAAGGSVSLTDAKGNQYTLAFPPNSVPEDTAVTMTAISTLTGINYSSGIVAGVKLEPDGLALDNMAILTVVPAGAFPVINQTGFAAAGDGTDLHGAPPGPDFQKQQIYIHHFSFWGWLFMSPEERRNEMRTKLAAQNEARLMDWISRYLGAERYQQILGAKDSGISTDPPPSIDQMAKWFDAYYDLVVTPRLLAAAADCTKAAEAWGTVSEYYRWRSKLGVDPPDGNPQFAIDLAKVQDALRKFRKTPCYLKEDATYTDGRGTAEIHVQWKIVSQNGNVFTYKPAFGFLKVVDYVNKPCVVTNPVHDIATSDGELTIDWGTGTYKGMAQHNTTLVTGPGPRTCDTISTPYPVFYLGLLTPASGPVTPPTDGGADVQLFTTDATLGRLSLTGTMKRSCAQGAC